MRWSSSGSAKTGDSSNKRLTTRLCSACPASSRAARRRRAESRASAARRTRRCSGDSGGCRAASSARYSSVPGSGVHESRCALPAASWSTLITPPVLGHPSNASVTRATRSMPEVPNTACLRQPPPTNGHPCRRSDRALGQDEHKHSSTRSASSCVGRWPSSSRVAVRRICGSTSATYLAMSACCAADFP